MEESERARAREREMKLKEADLCGENEVPRCSAILMQVMNYMTKMHN